YLKELKPTNLEDLIAMIALYRPGPMELIPSYIKRKHGKERVTYLHPNLEPILKNTFGIAVYQEQLMQIARDLAGFTLAEADTLRKAVGKKIKSLLEEQKQKFVAGMIENKVEKSVARTLGEMLEPFARYGFNRSHAACYAVVGYQTAYLKTYYPLEFMTALMNADEKDIDRISFLVREAKELGTETLPPDINYSYEGFTPENSNNKKAIRFGLRAIKNVGANAVRAIIRERGQNGSFTSIGNLLDRIPAQDLNRKTLEALVKSGALDSLGERAQFLQNMDVLLDYHRETQQKHSRNQNSLFAGGNEIASSPRLAPATLATKEDKLSWEKELLGLFVSGHPLEKYRAVLEKQKINIARAKTLKNRAPVVIAGMIEEAKKVLTKNNEPMLFLKLADFTDTIEAVVFPRLLSAHSGKFAVDACVAIKGTVSMRNGNPSIICEDARLLSELNGNGKANPPPVNTPELV
ncbi:MAG: DNA polymerase III subunit alpha, partial [Patescibacteria group bacterium]